MYIYISVCTANSHYYLLLQQLLHLFIIVFVIPLGMALTGPCEAGFHGIFEEPQYLGVLLCCETVSSEKLNTLQGNTTIDSVYSTKANIQQNCMCLETNKQQQHKYKQL